MRPDALEQDGLGRTNYREQEWMTAMLLRPKKNETCRCICQRKIVV
jgi:hypothetical protein